MGKISKIFAIFLTLTVAMSCLTILTVKHANAQSVAPNTSPISKPSVPTFTLKFVDNSYSVPSVTYTTTDTYTGKQTVNTEAGYHVQNDSIVISITNQPFASYVGPNYNIVSLFNAIRWKGHYTNNWYYAQSPNSGENNTYFQASSLNETSDSLELVFGVGGNDPIPNMSPSSPFTGVESIGEPGGQIDFQVMSFIGYYTTFEGYSPNPIIYPPTVYFVYTGQSSDWSTTETINIPNGTVSISTSPTLTSSPSPTSTVPELSWLAIIPLLASVLGITLMVRRRRVKSINSDQTV
jgi:hypothetical protein